MYKPVDRQPIQHQLRPMSIDDLDAVVALEQQLFETPWDRLRFQRSLEREQPAWVATVSTDSESQHQPSNNLIGYLVASSGAGVADLLTIGVAPECQGGGVAAGLLQQLLSVLRVQQVEELFLEVRASNKMAIRFYRNKGFVQVGIRRNYYRRPVLSPDTPEGREDGLLFKRQL